MGGESRHGTLAWKPKDRDRRCIIYRCAQLLHFLSTLQIFSQQNLGSRKALTDGAVCVADSPKYLAYGSGTPYHTVTPEPWLDELTPAQRAVFHPAGIGGRPLIDDDGGTSNPRREGI